MYVAVKGGERAIENAHRLLAHERRGDRDVPEVTLAQVSEQLSLGVDRVMTEGSLYDRELAALAIKHRRAARSGHHAGARRRDRGDLPGPRVPRDLAALRRHRAGRDRRDGGAPPDFLDLQGHSGRPNSRTHLRLHPPPAGSATGRWLRSRTA